MGLTAAPHYAAAGETKIGQTKWPECYCTDRYGKRHEIGDIICLTVDSRSYEAKCVMAQNNPFWRDLNRGCLAATENIAPPTGSCSALPVGRLRPEQTHE
mgnify:CR=1 FL=1